MRLMKELILGGGVLGMGDGAKGLEDDAVESCNKIKLDLEYVL